MPNCPECGSEVEIGAIVCPSCGVYPGLFPDDGTRPVVRAPTALPSSEEPSFSFALAALQALLALVATLALVWWAHGPLDINLPIEELVPEVALRLNRGFSISIPAVLLIGFWAAYTSRRHSWTGYGLRFLSFAAITTAITLGPSYLESQKEPQVATQSPQPEALDPSRASPPQELPSTGIPALDAQLKAIHQATLKAQEAQAERERDMLGLPAPEQALSPSPQPSTPPRPRLDPDELAMCMTDRGAIFYGTPWCSACKHQKRAFGSAIQFINYVDCDREPDSCATSRIRAYPTWEIAGRHYQGSRPLPELAQLSDCAPEGFGNYPEPSRSPSPIVTMASYTWRDKNGTLHVTSEPPPQDALKIEVVE